MAWLEHLDDFSDEFEEHWNRYTFDATGERVPLPADWRDSVERWLEHGLTLRELHRYIDRTMAAPRSGPGGHFRYLAGCAWGELTDRQEMARRLIEDGQV
jgi:hypothetical protein